MLFYLLLLDSEEDKNKFEQLYTAYRDSMYYAAYRILRDIHQAEEAVHEAFLRIMKKFSCVGEVSCPQTKSFCVVVCRNIALDLLRKNKKRMHASLDESWEEIPDSVRVDEEAISSIGVEIISNRILQLPDIYKDIFLLYYSNGYSLKQIAGILDISHDAAKKRLQRARTLLIHLLQKEDIKNHEKEHAD